MTESDLGPMPDPQATDPEPNPGGVDAIPELDETIPADPPSGANPAVQDHAPEDVQEAVSGGEDTSTQATKGEDSDDEKESPA